MTNEKEMPARIWIDEALGMVGYVNEPPPPESDFKYEYVRADLLKEVIAKVKGENPPHNAGNEFARGFARAKKTILGQLEAAATENRKGEGYG